MADATKHFFEDLRQRGHEPLLERFAGSVRFDLRDGKRTDHYFVVVKKGDISISQANRSADCVVISDRALFDDFARGEKNMMTAFLRGEITLQGDPQLLVLFQRVFPGPPPARDQPVGAGRERRSS